MLPFVLGLFLGCGEKEETKPKEEKVEAVEQTPEKEVEKPKEPTPAEVIDTKATVSEAFEYAKLFMDDQKNKSSTGTFLFAYWAKKNLRWFDVFTKKDETSFGMIKKDADPERGKRMCWSGTIVQIAKVDQVGFAGLLMTKKYDIIHFFAAGSTGSLVENSRARFCGLVTGLYTYDNSGGGVSHGIDMVGMFKLKENTK